MARKGKKDDFIRVKLDDRDLQKDLRRAVRACVKMKPAWDEVGEIAVSSILRTFREEGRPEKWQPFSPKYKRKRGNMASAKLLVDNEILRGSIENQTKSVRHLGNHGIDVRTNVKYAAIHNYGGTVRVHGKKVEIPARPFMVLQREDITEAAAAIRDHIIRSLI